MNQVTLAWAAFKNMLRAGARDPLAALIAVMISLLGQETVVFQTMARALDSEKSGITYSQQHTARPLLTPDEVRNMPAQTELLFLAGQRPIVAAKLAYYADPEFRGAFDPA